MKKLQLLIIGALLPLLFFPSVNASASFPENPREIPNWGFILDQNYTLNLSKSPALIYGKEYWASVTTFSIEVFGIGRHTIQWKIEGNATCYYIDSINETINFNKTEQKSFSWQGKAGIWLFNLKQHLEKHGRLIQPRIKTIEYSNFLVPLNITASAGVYIDGELVWNDTQYWEHSS